MTDAVQGSGSSGLFGRVRRVFSRLGGHDAVADQPLLSPEFKAALAAHLMRRAEERAPSFPNDHVVFERFRPRTIVIPEGHTADYFGMLLPATFGASAMPGTYHVSIPEVNEEYFEVIDVLEAVLDADDTFTMMEWGAGYGRWSGLAVGAAREKGVPTVRLALAEAEPVHAQWIREYMALNNVAQSDFRLYEVALSNKLGETLFLTGMPEGNDSPSEWYGQAIGKFDPSAFELNGKDYHGLPEWASPGGWRGIKAKLVPASHLLADYDFVDLVDMDLQGAEADAVEEGITLLNERVRRLHIGTHGHDLEERLRQVLLANDWILIRDLPCMAKSATSFGEVDCGDGVQSWFNPRFPPKDWEKSA